MTKVISISDKAYNELTKMKNGLSFSEVIITITKEKRRSNIMKFAGMLSDEEGKKMLAEIKKIRKMKTRRML